MSVNNNVMGLVPGLVETAIVAFVVLEFNIKLIAKIMETGPLFKVSSKRLEKPGIELTTPAIQARLVA